MPATYDGNPIFGTAVRSKLVVRPGAKQETAYPGVAGVSSLFLGTRGAVIEISGLLYATGGGSPADNRATVTAAEAVFMSYQDGIARVLIDSLGRTFNQAVCGPYQQVGPSMFDAAGDCFQRYTITFESLL